MCLVIFEDKEYCHKGMWLVTVLLSACCGDGLCRDALRFSPLILSYICVLILVNLDRKGVASVSVLALRRGIVPCFSISSRHRSPPFCQVSGYCRYTWWRRQNLVHMCLQISVQIHKSLFKRRLFLLGGDSKSTQLPFFSPRGMLVPIMLWLDQLPPKRQRKSNES